MKYFLLSFAFIAVTASAQDDVIIPWPGSPYAEGVVTPGEWVMESSIRIPAFANDSCIVAIAVDEWGLYLAYIGHLESATLLPEVLLDPLHDRTTGWNADDHWYHVSATACHYQGMYGVFDDCTPLPVEWSAHPLMNAGPPETDTIEIAIPWFMLGVMPQPGDTIGFCALLTNTVTTWNRWPAGADRDSPGTWGHLVFPTGAGVEEAAMDPMLLAWPVPSSGELQLSWDAANVARRIVITDAAGRIVADRLENISSNAHITGLEPGSYCARVEFTHAAMRTARFIVH